MEVDFHARVTEYQNATRKLREAKREAYTPKARHAGFLIRSQSQPLSLFYFIFSFFFAVINFIV